MPNEESMHRLSDIIVEEISEAILVVDAGGSITYANKATLALFGYEKNEIIGEKVETLVPLDLREIHAAHRDEYMKTPRSRPMGMQFDLSAMKKDGTGFPVEIGLSAVEIEGETFVIAIITDNTKRQDYENTLKKNEERWHFALEGSYHGVWDWNIQTGKEFFSGQWKRILGFGEDEIVNSNEEWKKRIHPDDLGHCLIDMEKHFNEETDIYINKHRMLCKNGTYKWVEERGKLISRTPDGQPLRMVGTYTDISDQKTAEEILRTAALKDPLTGLSNRREFIANFEAEASRFRRYGHEFSIVLGDIDHFKHINDTCGHDSGDMVLKRIAEIMTTSLREQDSIGRWGGEEFIILMPETDIDGGIISTEKIRKKIAGETFIIDDKEVHLTMSFGVSVFGRDIKLDEIVRIADKRLYKAKADGRNRVVAED